ncbi:hypothetical protein GCM10010211_36070 [Streptomyces albospinus]|uniref:Uncharacterized protein n=2 Tax=Streptomyces albospinus TaxID=285515 RepID=A0ABQ2V3N0_9ACTN|nr:hypothetical protein [Streptomyces albospinus]GGU67526.1 hypothetical protein GCM10010211_36070 [Streptomyces albospinus]
MIPAAGSYAMDGRDGRIGRVSGHRGPFVQLRPPGGGAEWNCPPGLLRGVPRFAALAARLRDLNWQSSRIP